MFVIFSYITYKLLELPERLHHTGLQKAILMRSVFSANSSSFHIAFSGDFTIFLGSSATLLDISEDISPTVVSFSSIVRHSRRLAVTISLMLIWQAINQNSLTLCQFKIP